MRKMCAFVIGEKLGNKTVLLRAQEAASWPCNSIHIAKLRA